MQQMVFVIIIISFILFRIYRRTRSIVGFQKFVKWRMLTRITLMTIVGVIFLVTEFSNPVMYIFDAIGILLGGILAYYAIRTSSFEWRKDDWFYSRNRHIGMFFLVLFVGRIAFKVYQIIKGTFVQPVQLANYFRDPSTTVMLFMLIIYYLVYYTFLIRTEREMKTNGQERGDKTSAVIFSK